MNPFKTLKILMPILGLGAVVFFAPSARAQESDPQIFDNYEAAAAPVKAKSQPKATKAVSAQARSTRTKETPKATMQPASHRQSQTAQPSTVAAPSMRNSRRRDSDRP